MVASHHAKIALAIADNGVWRAFNQNSKPMRAVCQVGKEPMKQDQNNASADCGKKRRRSVDGAGKHRRENDEQHGIERGFVRERTLMAESYHDQRRKEDDDSAQRNLNERQILRLYAQTEQCFKKVPECIHRVRVYRRRKPCRAHAALEVAAGRPNTWAHTSGKTDRFYRSCARNFRMA